MRVGLIVPVLKNFSGFAEMMSSVDYPVLPIVIPNWDENIGVSAGWNRGLDVACRRDCEYSLICNDDIIFAPGTIEKLVEAIGQNPYHLVSARNTRDFELGQGFQYAPDYSCFIVESCHFVNTYGYFDENFTPAYFEDNDMAYRMGLAGSPGVCRMDAGIYHRGSVTQNWGGKQIVDSTMFQRNRAYYVRKWGGEPGKERYVHPFDDPSRQLKDW